MNYQEWIDKNIDEADMYGNCKEITMEMNKVFPELKLVRGHYYCLSWGEREHWWLVDKDNNIIDPTAKQFPSKGRGEYIEWDKNQEEPIGICLNCGNHVYKDTYFGSSQICSKNCEISFISSLTSGY
jgi:hypothetical protein